MESATRQALINIYLRRKFSDRRQYKFLVLSLSKTFPVFRGRNARKLSKSCNIVLLTVL